MPLPRKRRAGPAKHLSRKARAARIRNFNLLRLRGMFYQAFSLMPSDTAPVQAAIDRAILMLGGEPESNRMVRRSNERYAERADSATGTRS